jgi:hypothetical protein
VVDLVADQRDLAERPVEDFFAQMRVALEHEAEHRDEDEQQREQRDESVVGDQRGHLPRLIVQELPVDGRDERDARAALLTAVEPAKLLVENHRAPITPARLAA